MSSDTASTGLPGLDEILQNLKRGDNVVFQVDDIKDYRYFLSAFVKRALKEGKKVIYIRFASHEPLFEKTAGITVYDLDARTGFEAFSKNVHDIITKEGRGAYYAFDCLSDLLSAWATDLMIGNFFMVTCPYLFKMDTVAYFAVLRNNHSFKTIARIRDTTQLLLDVYFFEGAFYVHPIKVWNRYSPTMFLPHQQEKESFVPIINTVDATRLFSYMSAKSKESSARKLDYWDRLFLKAEDLLSEARPSKKDQMEMFDSLCGVMLGKEKRMMELAKRYFGLKDLMDIKSRLIGTGFIGGKALGMLLARKILLSDDNFEWKDVLEPHDSFYIGSDVFYTYLVENGWWEMWLGQKTSGGYFEMAKKLQAEMLNGNFPEELKEQFNQMLEYYGQSPIIVRSSSLLEDSFGNAFAGKYESIFCVNQGTPDSRYQQFEEIVRRVFASTMNEDALVYRMQKELSSHDEQMALLVQRVSGTRRKQYFFPFIAGMGVSYNTFVWKSDMDPKAGMLRIVLGLGTRAVNRTEGDYPRIAALAQPLLKPYAGMNDARKFSQHEVDVLDIEKNKLTSVHFLDLLKEGVEIDTSLIGEKDYETTDYMKSRGIRGESWILSFDNLLSNTRFTQLMSALLGRLQEAYDYPVDVEFTVNFTKDGNMQINIVQCRPLQAKGFGKSVMIPKTIDQDGLIFESHGNFMGGSVSQQIKRIVYVDAAQYIKLGQSDKYEVARIIGELNRMVTDKKTMPMMLIGPGRMGTTDPSLGVPAHFAEINNMTALCEIAYPSGGLMPDLSFGSHFFLDLVEASIFYSALFTEEENVFFNKEWLNGLPNVLGKLLPERAKFTDTIKVFDFDKEPALLLSDISTQRVVMLKCLHAGT